jgi:hydroxymethylbilane synthase
MINHSSPLIFGTRGSALARAQTSLVMEGFGKAFPEVQLLEKIVTTTGDAHPELPLDQPLEGNSGVGLFTKQLEEALLRKEIDVAVHSLKDLPIKTPQGLKLVAILPRANHGDLLISLDSRGIEGLEPNSVIGTSSPRRIAFLEHHLPDHQLQFLRIRGNVPTRLRKLAMKQNEKPLDAVILAAAGLERLGYSIPLMDQTKPTSLLIDQTELFIHPLPWLLPAPGQGAIAVEMRETHPLIPYFSSLHHLETEEAVTTERLLLSYLGGGCHMALGALAKRDKVTKQLSLHGCYLAPNTQEPKFGRAVGKTPQEVARAVALSLM